MCKTQEKHWISKPSRYFCSRMNNLLFLYHCSLLRENVENLCSTAWQHQLMKEVPTHWKSTYYMVEWSWKQRKAASTQNNTAQARLTVYWLLLFLIYLPFWLALLLWWPLEKSIQLCMLMPGFSRPFQTYLYLAKIESYLKRNKVLKQ